MRPRRPAQRQNSGDVRAIRPTFYAPEKLNGEEKIAHVFGALSAGRDDPVSLT